jgi:hypothetical protein
MDKIDALIVTIQREIRRHDWDTFQEEIEPGGRKVTVPGCPVCRKQIGTMPEFLDHVADAIPLLFEKLRAKKLDGVTDAKKENQ